MSNEANITIDDARALVADSALWPRIRDFIWDFAPQVHKSWLEGLPGLDVSEAVAGSPRVKRYILDALGVEPCFHSFPKDDCSRLLVLDGATLESMAKWLGALACAESLRRIADGKSVRALKAALPGIYPEVFGYTMYFKDLVSRGDAELRSEDIAAGIVEDGYGLLFSALSSLPAPVVSRAKFKFPKGLRVVASPREIGLSTVSKLLKLKFPEAYSLCC